MTKAEESHVEREAKRQKTFEAPAERKHPRAKAV